MPKDGCLIYAHVEQIPRRGGVGSLGVASVTVRVGGQVERFLPKDVRVFTLQATGDAGDTQEDDVHQTEEGDGEGADEGRSHDNNSTGIGGARHAERSTSQFMALVKDLMQQRGVEATQEELDLVSRAVNLEYENEQLQQRLADMETREQDLEQRADNCSCPICFNQAR